MVNSFNYPEPKSYSSPLKSERAKTHNVHTFSGKLLIIHKLSKSTPNLPEHIIKFQIELYVRILRVTLKRVVSQLFY